MTSLLEHNLLAGYAVGKDYPGLENHLLDRGNRDEHQGRY